MKNSEKPKKEILVTEISEDFGSCLVLEYVFISKLALFLAIKA